MPAARSSPDSQEVDEVAGGDTQDGDAATIAIGVSEPGDQSQRGDSGKLDIDVEPDQGLVDTKLEPNPLPADGPPDGGKTAWLAVAASWFCHFILMGSGYSYGLFQRYYIANSIFPGTSTTQYALVGGLCTFCGFLSGPACAILANRLGNRTTASFGSILFGANFIACSFAPAFWLIALCQGVLFGVTSMIVWIPALQVAPQWFAKKRGLAVGICVSGAGIGGLALGPLTQFLLDRAGFRWALRAWGLGGGTICLLASFFLKVRVAPPGQLDLWAMIRGKKQNAESKLASAAKQPSLDLSLFRNFRFTLLFLAAFFIFWGQNLPLYFIAQYSTSFVGIGASTAAVVLGVLNGCGTAGRIGFGYAADKLETL